MNFGKSLQTLENPRPGSVLSLADDRNWAQLHWPEKQIGGFKDLARLRNLKSNWGTVPLDQGATSGHSLLDGLPISLYDMRNHHTLTNPRGKRILIPQSRVFQQGIKATVTRLVHTWTLHSDWEKGKKQRSVSCKP